MVSKLEEGLCSTSPALGLRGCVQQHAQRGACQQLRVLARGLGSEGEGKAQLKTPYEKKNHA